MLQSFATGPAQARRSTLQGALTCVGPAGPHTLSKRYLPSQYLLTIPKASCSLKALHTAQAALWLNCFMNHLGTSGNQGVEGTHPAQFSPPGLCLLSVQAATLDECIASDAANASAVAEKHLTAMRRSMQWLPWKRLLLRCRPLRLQWQMQAAQGRPWFLSRQV